MISSLLVVFLMAIAQTPLEDAQQHMQSGNYVMAEVELLRTNPNDDPVQTAALFSELAIRMRTVPGKMDFARDSLLPKNEWRTTALLALANLALNQKDWSSFETYATDFLKDGTLKTHPVRFQLLYHFARHTALSELSLPLSADEFAWVRLCRELNPSQTWPNASELKIPYLFRYGYLLEKRTSFTPQEPTQPVTVQEDFFAQLLRARNDLNIGDLNQVALTINRLLSVDRTSISDHLRMHLYQIMLEYFQRKQDPASAVKTAQNLDLVRERAFFPILSWPSRIMQVKSQVDSEPTLDVLNPTSSPQTPIPPPTIETAEPLSPTQESSVPNQDELLPPQEEAEVLPSEQDLQALENLVIEPDSTGIDPPDELPMEEESAFETEVEPVVEEMPDEPEPKVNLVTKPPVSETQLPDANLALARALMVDGDDLMAEVQFMAVNPRNQDVLEMGVDLATLAMRTQSVANKETFFRTYLKRTDAWRGVALTVLAAFSAQQLDWPSFETFASQLIAEFSPLQGPVKYRLLYYLARFTPYQPTQLRPVEALWFQRSRDLNSFALWPECQEIDLPFPYLHGHLLETNQTFQVPQLPLEEILEPIFFQKLLVVREALNRADFNTAAQNLNALKDLSDETLDPQWRVFHQNLSSEYFEKRGELDHAAVAKRNAAIYQNWVAFPLQVFPARSDEVRLGLRNSDAAVPAIVETSQSVQIAKPDLPKSTEIAKADRSEKAPTPIDSNSSWLDFEKAIQRGNVNFENTLRSKEPTTTYDRIYKAYLLGTLYLKRGRYQSAYERLTLAENLVRDLPFPLLESKVMLGMADYYEFERNEQQANWYRIAAVQIWNQPANIPILFADETSVSRSPFPELLDQSLKKTASPGTIHTLIYYNELSLLLNLRNKAYRRGQLSDNRAIGQQLSSVGQDLAKMVNEVATVETPSVTPRQFNEIQKLWTGLWDQAYPYYREEQVPGLAALQASLEEDERLVAFLEGNLFFGVLILSRDQNFAVGLGNKANFFTLPTEQQFDFLEGRLGPVWSHPGRLTLQLSPSFQNKELMDQLQRRMTYPEQLRFVYSLKNAMASSQSEIPARTLMMFPNYATAQPNYPVVSADPTPTTFWGETVTKGLLFSQLEQHHHLVISGSLVESEQGLSVQTGDFQVFLHELPAYQERLGTLSLVVESSPPMTQLIEELALIQVRWTTAIQVTDRWLTIPNPLPDRHFHFKYQP